MSYRNYNYGIHLPISCHNNKICIKFHTGEEYYETTLTDEIQEQVLFFNLPEFVLFVAEENGVRYIGREDGSISGYRISDNVLVRIASWKTPPKPKLQLAGYVNEVGLQPAYVDNVRKRIIYLKDRKAEFDTKSDFLLDVSPTASMSKALYGKGLNLSIVTTDCKEVDAGELGYWRVQTFTQEPSVRGIF